MLEATGEVVLTILGDEDRAIEIATKLAEMLDWPRISEPAWATMSGDPVFLSFLAEHYMDVRVPMPDDLNDIVPYADDTMAALEMARDSS